MARPRNPINANTYSGRFAIRMKELREKKGLTVEKLAEKTGLPMVTLYSWENTSRSPVNDDLVHLAKGLGTSVRNLLPKE